MSAQRQFSVVSVRSVQVRFPNSVGHPDDRAATTPAKGLLKNGLERIARKQNGSLAMPKRPACVLVILCLVSRVARGQTPDVVARAQIAAFNRALDSATRHMNNTATLALWEDDGVSLLPSTKPIVGKRAIADFLTSVTSQMVGARMESFTMTCHDIEVSGDWASECCIEHQIGT